MDSQERLTRDSGQQLDELCDRFEKAWQSGQAPEVSQFLASRAEQWQQWEPATRRQLLEDLIRLDLIYRWQLHEDSRQTAAVAELETLQTSTKDSQRRFLEDYIRQHPELGSSGQLALELVLEEYRVRHLWGDRPSHEEYLRRFPDHASQLQDRLVRIDADLSAGIDTQHRHLTRSNTLSSPSLASGRFGDYELLEEIARGGMGVVYKARQVSLNRTVAVKMILSGQLASEQDVRRFRTEAESAANLQHPHIVTIHEVGELAGQHYFSMDFIEGQSLAQRVAGGPLRVEQAAELVSKIAAAIDYAHQQGILHRDLKPQNVLIDSANKPWVTDFGLAKIIEQQSDLTGTGQLLGTPSYMPPEQAGADFSAIGPASDIYSLGAILYELVTARPPFLAENPLDTLTQVVNEEPMSPHALNGSVPVDLETIILKCLEKDPRRRYQSAGELIEELDRFRRGEPISARPIGQIERAWRWCKRKPALAGLYGTAAILLLILGVGGPMVAIEQMQNANQEARLRRQADRATAAAHKNLEAAEAERTRADREAATAHKNLEVAEAEGKRADREAALATANAEQALRNLRVAERNLYNSDMSQAQGDWTETNLRRLTDTIQRYRDQEKLKGFEWYYWNRLLQSAEFTLSGHVGSVDCVLFSPDGKWLASAGNDQTIRVSSATTGQEACILKGHAKKIRGLSFTLDGQRLASASEDGTVKIWDVAAGKELATFAGHRGFATSVSFHPGGKRLASGGTDNTVRIWDVTSGEEIKTLTGHRRKVSSVAYSPDGKRLASASFATSGLTVRLWDETGSYVGSLVGHPTNVESIVFSPDGKFLAAKHLDVTGREGSIQVWNALSKREVLTIKGCGGGWNPRVGFSPNSMSLAFSPDSRRLAAPGDETTVKVWDLPSGKELLRLKGHLDRVASVAFSPDGKYLASASQDQTVKVWDTALRQDVLTLQGHSSSVESVAFSPDGQQLASGSGDGTVRLWEVASQQGISTLTDHQTSDQRAVVETVVYSPDGKLVASRSSGNKVIVWNSTGRQRRVINLKDPIRSVLFTPDGSRMVVGTASQLRLCDAMTGRNVEYWSIPFGSVRYVSFSPDGKRMVTGGRDNTLKVWDVKTRQEILTFQGRLEQLTSLAFSPDGTRIVSGDRRANVKIWDAHNGQEILTLQGHTAPVTSSLFSPDGKRVASGSEDQTVKVWSAETGQEIMTLRGHRGYVTSLAFSPDGKRLASGSQDKTIKIWGELMRSQRASGDAQPE